MDTIKVDDDIFELSISRKNFKSIKKLKSKIKKALIFEEDRVKLEKKIKNGIHDKVLEKEIRQAEIKWSAAHSGPKISADRISFSQTRGKCKIHQLYPPPYKLPSYNYPKRIRPKKPF